MTVGCGHPATKAECDEIFRISASIKLREQEITDPAEVAKRTDDARAVRSSLVDKCIGRRITDGAMQCIRGAQTAAAFDACLSW